MLLVFLPYLRKTEPPTHTHIHSPSYMKMYITSSLIVIIRAIRFSRDSHQDHKSFVINAPPMCCHVFLPES
ncbi:hypothetical protein HanRHA438_Chr08g0342611 [Helianthus annuus]|nr:hypothetical protein HanRHA438_Chr08g0342611 [Helianthus annuus]